MLVKIEDCWFVLETQRGYGLQLCTEICMQRSIKQQKRKLLENGFELALWLSFRLLRISNGKCLLYRRTDLLTRSTDLC